MSPSIRRPQPATRALWFRAPAKVNLALDVGAVRPDGYHSIRTVMQTVTLFDHLRLAPGPSVEVACDTHAIREPRENLAWRAADLLRQTAGVSMGVRMRLVKRIPLGAGLGGGSADAAAALLGCARLWGLAWDRAHLAALAAELGSDVAFFLMGGTGLASGRGERVLPLPALPPWPVVVARTGAQSATAAAYAALDAAGAWPHPDTGPVVAFAQAGPRRSGRRALARCLGNSFESVLLPTRPDVAALRADLLARGALACVLAGSGSALWALAPSTAWSRAVVAALRAHGVWAASARFWPAGVAGAGHTPLRSAPGR